MSAARVSVGLGDRGYEVTVGDDLGALLAGVPADLLSRIRAVIVDSRVRAVQPQRMAAIAERVGDVAWVEVAAGEGSKSIARYADLLAVLLDAGLDRGSALLAVGGGVVTDLAGFVAATLLRGIDWVALPSSLLAMVDASVGGKTGINHAGAKNVVGAFHQPRAVVVDVGFLPTLDPRELRSGMAEVVKAGVIADLSLFERVARDPAACRDPHAPLWIDLIAAAIAVKAEVVVGDEREAGRRAILNFGHTVGHALEAATGMVRLTHGEAVAVGMVVAARLSVREVGLPADDAARLERCLVELGLPVREVGVSSAEVCRWLGLDKKRVEGVARFVLTPRLGSASFGHRIAEDIVIAELETILGGSPG
jgi:3-dehydroquinate synthase